jgi:hypothetical protein
MKSQANTNRSVIVSHRIGHDEVAAVLKVLTFCKLLRLTSGTLDC